MMKYKKYPIVDYIDFLYNKAVEEYGFEEKTFEDIDKTAKNINIFNKKENFIKILNIIFNNKSELEMESLYLQLKTLTPANIINKFKIEKINTLLENKEN